MKLGLPFTPFAVRVSLTREEGGSWGRLSLGSLILLVAIASIVAAIGVQQWKVGASRIYVNTYAVGDLLAPGEIGPAPLDRLARRLDSSVPLETWYPQARTVTAFPLSRSLIIRDTARGHRRVRAWLDELRSRRGIAGR